MRRQSNSLLLFAGLLAASQIVAANKPQQTQVPFVAGMVVTGSLQTPQGDYEPLMAVMNIQSDRYQVRFSSEVPKRDGAGRRELHVNRTVLMRDHREARKMRSHYFEGDPEIFRGVTPFLSSAVVNDLRRGKAELTVLSNEAMLGIPLDFPYRGTLTRIAKTTADVLVNGKKTALRAIHAAGKFEYDGETRSADVLVLDDPGNPLFLRWTEANFSSRIVRIEYPPVGESEKKSGLDMERELLTKKPIAVYGIYFAFASAVIRPQSERTLREIAAILQRNPDWKLRLDGHTDSVGGDAANLDLSRRRSAAVKAALVSRFQIATDRLVTGGYGEGGAIDTNDTPEGRARNRRVMLTRIDG